MDLTRLREQVSLEGKVAIVTGAFHKGGIGLAAAKELAARGAEIVLTDRPPYAAYAGAAQAALKKMGSYAVGVTADTFTLEGAKQVADAALNAFGAIDILINTAPLYCGYRRIEQVPDQDWQAAYEGNILGTAEICRAVIPHMAKHRQPALRLGERSHRRLVLLRDRPSVPVGVKPHLGNRARQRQDSRERRFVRLCRHAGAPQRCGGICQHAGAFCQRDLR